MNFPRRQSMLGLSAFAVAGLATMRARAQAPGDAGFEDAMIAAQYEAASKAAATRAAPKFRDGGTPVLGNPGGDVTFVEFFDYQCPYCKAAEPRIRTLIEDDGNIAWVIKDFPILSPVSLVAAKAALASMGQGKFAEFHHAMMDYRGQLKDETVFAIAKSVGLDVARLESEMIAPTIADQLFANFNLARMVKVSVVPGFIVNGRVLAGVSGKTETAKIDFVREVAAARAG
ncbi:MAG: DsbA family protein [Rhodobacteraceae bacterium]|nr:DsbA family protein [Paracoccaceae bacterium]